MHNIQPKRQHNNTSTNDANTSHRYQNNNANTKTPMKHRHIMAPTTQCQHNYTNTTIQTQSHQHNNANIIKPTQQCQHNDTNRTSQHNNTKTMTPTKQCQHHPPLLLQWSNTNYRRSRGHQVPLCSMATHSRVPSTAASLIIRIFTGNSFSGKSFCPQLS